MTLPNCPVCNCESVRAEAPDWNDSDGVSAEMCCDGCDHQWRADFEMLPAWCSDVRKPAPYMRLKAHMVPNARITPPAAPLPSVPKLRKPKRASDDDESYADRAIQADQDRAAGIRNPDQDWLLPPP